MLDVFIYMSAQSLHYLERKWSIAIARIEYIILWYAVGEQSMLHLKPVTHCLKRAATQCFIIANPRKRKNRRGYVERRACFRSKKLRGDQEPGLRNQ